MNIKSIEVWRQNLALSRPYTIAYQTTTEVENIFILIELENGIRGIGAACPMEHVTGETLEHTLAVLQSEPVKMLEGKPIKLFQVYIKWFRDTFAKYPAALAAFDMALYDAFCQSIGLSVVDFLGRRIEKLPTSVTIGIKDVEGTLEDAREFVDAGFKILKVKLGQNLPMDIERLVKLRDHFGYKIGIRVDPNQGYSYKDLLLFDALTERLRIELVEQPVKVGDMPLLIGLPADMRDQIAADESLLQLSSAHQLLTPDRSCGIFNIKLMKCGGIQAAQEIANVAQSAGIDLMWGCNDESIVSITAALHVAFAQPHTKYIDLDGSFDLAQDVVSGGFVLEDGYMWPSDKAGLGLELI
ncbi:MAG TPA: dipeptide epimerase [Haliscomenobacter sp.]|nr:dipeptide epimerase [Haliscomenobacter sp.]